MARSHQYDKAVQFITLPAGITIAFQAPVLSEADEQVMVWNGNFRADGALMLVGCERGIDIVGFQNALVQHL